MEPWSEKSTADSLILTCFRLSVATLSRFRNTVSLIPEGRLKKRLPRPPWNNLNFCFHYQSGLTEGHQWRMSLPWVLSSSLLLARVQQTSALASVVLSWLCLLNREGGDFDWSSLSKTACLTIFFGKHFEPHQWSWTNKSLILVS